MQKSKMDYMCSMEESSMTNYSGNAVKLRHLAPGAKKSAAKVCSGKQLYRVARIF